MNCNAVERWLDEGLSGARADAARAHASVCPLCGPRLREAERLETLLASPFAAAPAGFADRVLARIAAEPSPRAVPAPVPAAPRRLPWWSWVGADPALPMALAAASVLLSLVQAAVVLASRPLPLPLPALSPAAIRAAVGGSALRAAAVTMAVLPPILLLSYALYRSAQGVVRTRLFKR